MGDDLIIKRTSPRAINCFLSDIILFIPLIPSNMSYLPQIVDRQIIVLYISNYRRRSCLKNIAKRTKSLNISMANQKPYIEEVTDNTMVKRKRKRTNGQTMIYRTLQRKQKIGQHEPTKTGGELRCSGRVSSSCSTFYR